MIQTVLKEDPDSELNKEVAKCLPRDGVKYFYLNIDKMQDYSEPVVAVEAQPEPGIGEYVFDQMAEGAE